MLAMTRYLGYVALQLHPDRSGRHRSGCSQGCIQGPGSGMQGMHTQTGAAAARGALQGTSCVWLAPLHLHHMNKLQEAQGAARVLSAVVRKVLG